MKETNDTNETNESNEADSSGFVHDDKCECHVCRIRRRMAAALSGKKESDTNETNEDTNEANITSAHQARVAPIPPLLTKEEYDTNDTSEHIERIEKGEYRHGYGPDNDVDVEGSCGCPVCLGGRRTEGVGSDETKDANEQLGYCRDPDLGEPGAVIQAAPVKEYDTNEDTNEHIARIEKGEYRHGYGPDNDIETEGMVEHTVRVGYSSAAENATRPVRFEGVLVGEASTHSHQGPNQDRFHEYSLFRVPGGYRVHDRYRTQWQGESNHSRLSEVLDAPGVAKGYPVIANECLPSWVCSGDIEDADGVQE